MTTSQAALDVTGTLLEGRYRLEHELGAGGMGTVWSAEDLQLRRRVAIKFPSRECRRSEAALARFAREARNAGKVRSPHVVQVFGQGVADDGIPYIVMELLEGHDLADQLATHGAASLALTFSVVDQVCRALSRAHQAGVIHRDIKPANIFVTPEGDGGLFVRVLDFGIAKDLGTMAVVLTQTKVGMGSLFYMSPEQFNDAKAVSPQTDVWSLGVVGYELLTGRLPFLADTAQEFVHLIASGTFPPPSSVVTTLPPGVDDFFARALQPDPLRRFGTADEMSSALARIVRGHASGVVMRTSNSGAKGSHGDAALPASRASQGRLAHGPRTKRVALAATAAVVLAGGAAWWRHEASPVAQASEPGKQNGAAEASAARQSDAHAELAARHDALVEEQRELKKKIEEMGRANEERLREDREKLEAEKRETDAKRVEYEDKLRKLPKLTPGYVKASAPTPAPIKPPANPNAFAPASESLHASIVQAVTRANAAEMRALRTLEGAALTRTHSGKLLQALQSEIRTLRANNEFRASALGGVDVQSVMVSRDQRTARVRTTETWETSWYDRKSSLCLRHVHQRAVPQTVTLRWVNGGWLLDEAVFDNVPDPVIVRCHYQ